MLAVLIAVFLPSAAWSDTANWKQLHGLVAKAVPIGDKHASATTEGQPVIVTFFASWCPPCTDEFEHLNALADSPNFGNTAIIGINLFENFGGKKNPARMTRFLERTNPSFPLVEGSEEMRIAFGNIDRIPTVVVYGTSGKEIWRFIHKRNATKTHVTRKELTDALKLARE